MLRYRILLCFAILLGLCQPAGAANPRDGVGGGLQLTRLGVAFSPAHYPNPSPEDIKNFFDLAASIGGDVTFITEWKDETPLSTIRTIEDGARARGLAFHLFLSPILLTGSRNAAAVPPSVKGNSFADAQVRKAFIAKALEFAALKPDVLGLGTEVNLLAGNAGEFESYASLVREAAGAIKERYPFQTLTVSFQWDKMITSKEFAPLFPFAGSIDLYSFTSYPVFFKDPARIPPEYYSSIRKVLPAARIGISEIGWSSAAGSDEDTQARFYARLPELMAGVRSEFTTLALMHDVSLFSGDQAFLNSVGVRRNDGTPKKSWEVIRNLRFDRR